MGRRGGRADARGPRPPRQEPGVSLPRPRAGSAPSTGIVDSQSVTSGPQRGERGVDGNKKVKGIKRHVLTCSFGLVLAVFVSAANLHDTHGLEPLLDRAAEAGWDLRRGKGDAIYPRPTGRPAGGRARGGGPGSPPPPPPPGLPPPPGPGGGPGP